MDEATRVVCWFSCGKASAAATRLALDKYAGKLPVVVAYCASVLATEHQDNLRFIKDCERWYGQPIELLYSDKYTDIYDVFERERWLVGPGGAKCTTVLKKKVRRAFEEIETDIQVWGFTVEEQKRWEKFQANNFELTSEAPLIDAGYTRAQCSRLVSDAGIELPAMYALGYRNNNCIGCVKGGQGYWNKIRVDFPDVFERMSKVERKLNAAICKKYVGKKRVRVFLDELDPKAGRYEAEPDWECGLACQLELL